MERRNKILRYTSYGIEVLLFYILQGVPNLIPEIFGGRPLLLIPLAICIACFEEEIPAMAFGVACGVMMDIGTGTHIGFYTITMTIICFFLGYFSDNYFNTKLLSVLALAVIIIPVLISMEFLFFYILKGYEGVGYYYLHHTLATAGYTFVTTPVFYGINRCISRGFTDSYII